MSKSNSNMFWNCKKPLQVWAVAFFIFILFPLFMLYVRETILDQPLSELAAREESGGLSRDKIFVELVHAFTGGPEALVQTYLALRDASTNTRWTVKALGHIHPGHHDEYRKQLAGTKISRDHEVDVNSIVVVPEMHDCAEIKKRYPLAKKIFVFLLQGGPPGPKSVADGCSLLSHSYYISRPHVTNQLWYSIGQQIDVSLPEHFQLTPYVSPSIVEDSLRHTGMLKSGRIFVSRLASPKQSVVLLDDDALLLSQNLLTQIDEKVKAVVPDVAFIVSKRMSRTKLMSVMKTAKVVYDDCMVGSERVVLEACLYGALVITNDCNVGSRFADVPTPLLLKGSPLANATAYVDEFAEAVVHALKNFNNLLPDFNAARLYYASLGKESLVAEAAHFLSHLE